MLRWRRKSELKRRKLWAKLVACSFGMHLIFLILLFVGYRDTIKFTFSMSGQKLPKKSAQVTLFTIPAPKKIAKRRTTRRVARRSVPRKKIVKPVTKVATKKVPVKKKLVQKTVKKISPKKVLAKAKPKFAPLQQVQGERLGKENKKKLVKNSVQKQSLPSFDKLRTSGRGTNSVNSFAAHPELVEGQRQNKQIQFDTSQNINSNVQKDFITLQQELARHWQPPVGIADECACAITAQINRQGKIDDVKIDTPSGVLMFDVAARTAMLAMNLPKWTWGKSLSITFKP